jgi:hypothetical protein
MIPNILWQTWKTKTLPASVESQANSWKTSNTQLKINLMNDAECSDFVLEHFGEQVRFLYNSLPQPIMRADFWRIAVVYIHGGYYSDLDIVCNQNIDQFIDPGVDAVFMREVNNISNYFFGAIPKHPVLKMTLDYMIREMQVVVTRETQSFGMHPLHQCVRDYYAVQQNNYVTNDCVQFLLDSDVRNSKTLVHTAASLQNNSDYNSWRRNVHTMTQDREQASNILFFTTFNRNGYELYGKEWIRSFSVLSNYYNKFRAKIFYEGFVPQESHPNITWVKYEDAILHHPEWKKNYLDQTQHSDYVRTMTVRFSHKAFVIQHVLDTESHDYLIWVDGDCVFKNANYGNFPKTLLGDQFLACQVEHAHDLNHVESGLLIFKGNHPDTKRFNQDFKHWYQVENILTMSQPYDGFLVFKSLLSTKSKYVDLNQDISGGIQSDPSMTFRHPAIKSKFIHNIGWTGKNQYKNWESVYKRDEVYQKMKSMLFNPGRDPDLNQKKQNAFNKLQSLRALKRQK